MDKDRLGVFSSKSDSGLGSPCLEDNRRPLRGRVSMAVSIHLVEFALMLNSMDLARIICHISLFVIYLGRNFESVGFPVAENGAHTRAPSSHEPSQSLINLAMCIDEQRIARNSLIKNFHVLVCSLIPLIMWNDVVLSHCLGGCVSEACDYVPSNTAVRQMV